MKHWQHHPGVRTGGDLTASERAVEATVRGIGSWGFLAGQTVIVGLWVTLNLVAWCRHWDPYPFILLNLAFSTQAAYATPLILLGQRRQDVRNAEVATHTLANTEATNAQLTAIYTRLDAALSGGAA